MHNDIQQVLISEEQLQARIAELGKELSAEYAGKNPVVIGVLKGVVVFYADMIRNLTIPCETAFMCVSSYAGTQSTGNMVVKMELTTDIKNRHVLILEDIFDTGNSLSFLCEYLKAKEPASMKVCTLLDKPEGRNPAVKLQADYVGFTIPKAFVVGYGLDYNEYYRNLPYVGILKPEVYEK